MQNTDDFAIGISLDLGLGDDALSDRADVEGVALGWLDSGLAVQRRLSAASRRAETGDETESSVVLR